MKSVANQIQNQSVGDLAEIIELQQKIANSPQNLEALMMLVCERTQALARASGATVEMHEHDEMVYRACGGSLSGNRGVRLKASGSLSGLCVKTGEVLYCEDSETDERVDREACRRVGARSMICVPLRQQLQNFGVLKVVSPTAKAFTEREINLLRLVAGFLSGSITQMTQRLSLEESELKFRTMIETAKDGFIISEGGKTINANPAFCAMFGYDMEELGGRSVLDYVSQENRARLEEYLQVGYDRPYETVCRRKDGSNFHAEVNARSIDLAGRRARVTTVRDITERKLIDTTLRESEHRARQADRAKSTFLANMSHEIRTPLNGIIGMAQLMRHTPLNKQQHEFLETICISSDALLALVNDILDLSKIEAQQMTIEYTPFNVSKIVEDIYKTMGYAATQKGLDFRCLLAPELNGVLVGDPTRVRQVILNLVNNAIKFTAHGSIEICARVMKLDSAKIKFRIEIRDTGIGIKADVLARLFKPFSQADASTTRECGGSGLGLSICKSLVAAMEGQIGVESRIEYGSTFWVELELAIATAQAQLTPQKAKVGPPQSNSKYALRILVAEDNGINAKVIDAMLAKLNYEVTVVGDGSGALKKLRSEPFDLVLMDCQMPGMDGYEATRQIRASSEPWSKIPIIALTANAMKDDVSRCLVAGMNEYISKPINYEQLRSTLQNWESKQIAS